MGKPLDDGFFSLGVLRLVVMVGGSRLMEVVEWWCSMYQVNIFLTID